MGLDSLPELQLQLDELMPTIRERLEQVLQTEEWIIDGNYASTMELRMQHCDTVIFLDYPLELCLQGLVEGEW